MDHHFLSVSTPSNNKGILLFIEKLNQQKSANTLVDIADL
jgi:hypothetical protein